MTWIALAVVYVVWGSTYFAIALVVQTMPPLFTAGVRQLIAGAIVALWVVARQRDAFRLSRRELLAAALTGTLLLAGGNGLVMVGERTVPSGLAALIIASVPLWLVVLRMAGGERVGAGVLAGVGLGIVGVAILVVPSGISGAIDPLGLLAIIGATFSWSIGTFLSPRLGLPRSVLASSALQQLAAGVVLLVAGLAAGERPDPSRFSLSSLVALGYLIAFGSLAAYSAYTWLLQNASVSLVSTYAYVNPVIAVFLGTMFLSEPLSTTTIAGAALIIVAVAFIVTRTATARRAARAARAA